MSADPLVKEVVDVLMAGVDPAELRKRLSPMFSPPPQAAAPAPPPTPAGDSVSEAARQLQSRIGLADILDDDILNAGPGTQAFPLRLFFGQLVAVCSENDVAFALASGLNLYFRATMGEEAAVVLGIEVSRLYYKFARAQLERELVPKLSPLLAQLMSTVLDKTELASVDHQRVFDSATHERDASADRTRPAIVAPLTFLCRVASTGRPRFKAMVLT